MSEHPLPRREFLLRALVVCGAPLLARPVFGQTGRRPALGGADRAADAAAGYLGAGSLAAARAIAEAYLTQMSIARTDEAITEAARATLETLSSGPRGNAAIAALVEGVRRDFAADRIIQLEGWIFSRTEVEICLLTLLPPRKQAAFALPSRG